MATRKPLVIVSGIKQQIQSGDYVDPNTLGSGTASASKTLRGDGTWLNDPRFFISDTAGIPSSPIVGDRWLNIDDGNIYTYYNDGDSSQWVEFRGADITSGIANNVMPVINPSTTPKDGDIRVTGSLVELWANGAWKQIYPAIYT